jgi:hypothetical protein
LWLYDRVKEGKKIFCPELFVARHRPSAGTLFFINEGKKSIFFKKGLENKNRCGILYLIKEKLMKKIVLRKMKSFGLFIACFLAFFLASCVMSDNVAKTEIRVKNNSSYDLSLSFEIKPLTNPNDGYEKISVRKNRTFSFSIETEGAGKSPPARNPNNEVVKIIFSNLDTGVVIKELDNNTKVFKSLGSEDLRATYELQITDELLQ